MVISYLMLDGKLQSMYQSAKSTLKSYVAPLVVAAALYAPVKSEAATTISSNIVQTDGANNPALVNYTITNSNVGAVFNTASVEFLNQFFDPLQYALDNNSALTGMSMSDLLANYVKISIDSGSNIDLVNQGWNPNLISSTGALDFSHGPFGYDVWRSSTEGTPHTLKYTIQFGDVASSNPLLQNIFDVNGDGIVQDNERLFDLYDWYNVTNYHTPSQGQVQNGFEGYMDIDNSFFTNVSKYTIGGSGIVPEPGRVALLGLGLGSLLLNRRRKN
jgi:hypothetical protein